ncbi:helix-turn-helix domain-containing protein [Enterococcus sp. LJL99]
MLYEQLMMDSGTLMKFKIFKSITKIKENEYSISRLSDVFSLNYQQTFMFLSEINNELKKIDRHHPSILKKAGKIDRSLLTITVDEYRYFLLKKSVPFQYLLYLLNDESPTIEDFCQKNFVSRSTVSRKMLPLQQHLKQFKLRFTYTESNLIGDERLVRVALYNCIWLGTRGTAWPFKTSREDAEKFASNTSDYFFLAKTYLGFQEMIYFSAIFLSRIRKKEFVKYDKRYDIIMKDNPYYDYQKLNKEIGVLKTLPAEQLKAEFSFIFLMSHYTPYYKKIDDPSLIQTIEDFTQKSNPVYALVSEFLAYSKKEIFLRNSKVPEHPLLLVNLLNVSFLFYVFRQPFPNVQRLVEKHGKRKKAEEFLEQKIQDFFDIKCQEKEYAYLYKVKKYIVQLYHHILLPYFDELQVSETLNVGIAFGHNYLLVQRIYHFLNTLGFIEASPYDENLNDTYDLVISSTLLPLRTYPDLPIYYWDLSDSEEELLDLYKALLDLFKTKNTVKK